MPLIVRCSHCGQGYPEAGLPYLCPACAGVFNIFSSPEFDISLLDSSQPGIWRYRHTFGLPTTCEAVSLGEGNTPLVWVSVFGRRIAFKCEYLNPTGSFKDRGSAVIAGWLISRGIKSAVEDSSGNAGASLAAYAARSAIQARIFVPASASGPKRRQIEAYGAALVSISGTRSDVSVAVKKVAGQGTVYASHAYLPFNIPGYATAAYEIFDQLGGVMPGAVILPVGQGGLLLGLAHGFEKLRKARNSKKIPRMIGVQAYACAPLKKSFDNENDSWLSDNPTLAEGVHVSHPVRDDEVIRAIRESGGSVEVVTENDILPGRDHLSSLGFHVEPTSAIVWPGLEVTINNLPDPVVVILTGSGYKYE